MTFRVGLLLIFVCVCFFEVSARDVPDGGVDLPSNYTLCLSALMRMMGDLPNGKAMIAASGYIPGKFGDYESCRYLPNAHFCTALFSFHPKKNTNCSIILPDCNTGICVPKICSAEEIRKLMPIIVRKVINVTIDTPQSVNCVASYSITWSNMLCIAMVAGFVTLALIGTLVEVLSLKYSSELIPCIFEQPPEEDVVEESGVVLSEISTNSENVNILPHPKPPSKLVEFFLAFSLIRNFQRLMTPIPGNFSSLNGLRVLSMFWIIYSHSYDYLTGIGLTNPLYVLTHVASSHTFQFVLNGEFAVDTFFFISGFLLSYFVMKELYEKGTIPLFLFYFHRFWRLLPLYTFLLFVYTNLSNIIANGPMWHYYREMIEKQNPYCWTNVLFINNFYPSYEHMCMRWSWFLANDMQFYVMSPLLLFLLYKYRYIGLSILGLLLATCWTVTGILVTVHKYGVGFKHKATQQADYFDIVYDKPYTRIAPYLIGIFAGYFLIFFQRRYGIGPKQAIKLPWVAVSAGFIFSGFFITSTVFGSYKSDDWNQGLSVFYQIFSRTAFTLGVALSVLLYCCGYGGLLKTVLSLKLWDPLSKLTYGAYLIHPVVIRVYYFTQPQPPTFNGANIFYWFLGNLILSYVLAAVAYVLVEKPFMNLEALFLPKKSRAK